MLRTYDDWKSCAPEGCAFVCEGCGALMGRPGTCSEASERDIIARYLGEP
jgi:hypothetical protein